MTFGWKAVVVKLLKQVYNIWMITYGKWLNNFQNKPVWSRNASCGCIILLNCWGGCVDEILLWKGEGEKVYDGKLENLHWYFKWKKICHGVHYIALLNLAQV